MEAIMKAFERMEKAQQRRQDSMAKTTHRKEPRDGKDIPDRDDNSGGDGEVYSSSPPPPPSTSIQPKEKRGILVQEARSRTFRRGSVFSQATQFILLFCIE